MNANEREWGRVRGRKDDQRGRRSHTRGGGCWRDDRGGRRGIGRGDRCALEAPAAVESGKNSVVRRPVRSRAVAEAVSRLVVRCGG